MPIEHVTGWLFRVARNRITDLFRKKKPESFSDAAVEADDGEMLRLKTYCHRRMRDRTRSTPVVCCSMS